MSEYESSGQQPITWWRGYPIHAAVLLVLIHVAALLLTTFFGRLLPLQELIFYSSAVLHGALWQPFTYVWIHKPDLWFALDMFILWRFGSDLERFFGRRSFLQLYFGLVLLPPLLLLALDPIHPTELFGSNQLQFAVFVAWATLYPNALMLFGVAAKWVALIFVGIAALQAIGSGDLVELAVLGTNVGAAWSWTRYQRGLLTLPAMPNPFRRQPRLRVVPRAVAEARPRRAPVSAAEGEMNALLDKIVRTGLDSLTAAERERLAAVREQMLRKGP